MKKILILIFCIVVLFGSLIVAEEEAGKKSPEHVIVFVLDGFRPDYLAMYNLPTLESLVEEGVYYANAKGVFPSTSTVNHTSLVTGAYPDVTGIPNNAKHDRELDQIVSSLRNIQVPTISEILKQAGKTTVVLAHYMLKNRGEVVFLEKGVYQFKQAISNYQPDLLVYYEADSDTYGHKYGPYSERMREKLVAIDRELGEMLAYLEEMELREKTAIIVVSDHGMSENTQPGVAPELDDLLEGSGFKVASSNREIKKDTDIVLLRAGCRFLYFREGQIDEQNYKKLMTVLAKIPHVDIYTAKELRKLHVDPEDLGDIVLVPHKGYSIVGGGGGGIHGRPEEEQITLILAGVGVQQGLVGGEARIIDVVPTILELLNVEIPETIQGKVLKRALEREPIGWGSYF